MNMSRHVVNLMALVVLWTWSTVIFAANAGPVEDDAYAAFETFCLSHLNQIDAVPALFEQIGILPLTDKQAKPFLAPQTGKAWLYRSKHARHVVMITDQGICSVTSPEAKGKIVRMLFEDNTQHTKLNSESMGSQTQDVYALTFPDPAGAKDGHAIVMITTSKLKSVDGVFLNALPENIIRQAGMSVPKWP